MAPGLSAVEVRRVLNYSRQDRDKRERQKSQHRTMAYLASL